MDCGQKERIIGTYWNPTQLPWLKRIAFLTLALAFLSAGMPSIAQLGVAASPVSLAEATPSDLFPADPPAPASSPRFDPAPPAFELPDAPEPQTPASSQVPKKRPCVPNQAVKPGIARIPPTRDIAPIATPCTSQPPNWYQRFVEGPLDKPLTPHDKLWLAVRNITDPFNAITILGEAGFSVGLNSHSPYGPGMPGYGRYVGVSYTEDITGEFFGTFAIPALAHQDPHYHRMEHATIPRRVFHAIAQVYWTESDSGKGMVNYANLVGFGIDDEIANLYIPGRETNAGASAERYGIGLATAPIGNFINEFLPDVASHIHVQIVVIQRIINQVARSETNGSTQ